MNPQAWLSAVAKDDRLTLTQRAVAMALWSFMDRHGRCFPGMQAIGERAGVRKRDTVRAALAALEERGHIVVQLQPRGRLSTNEYRAVDNSLRRPVKRVTTVTRLTDRRPPVERVTQGPPSNGSLTFPEGTKGKRSGSLVDNSPHPIVSSLADSKRIPS